MKAIFFSFLLLSGLFFKSTAQPFAIGHTAITYTDPARSNRQIATDIYYPAMTAGDNTAIVAGMFPLIVYGHGFVMTTSAYQNFWDVLVPQGYIIALPSTEGSFSPVHSDFGADLRFLISQIQSTGAGASVPVSSVASTSAVMGHSMGGGCSFLAAQNNTTITTMISFAAAVTNPSSITAAAQVMVPTLVFSGTNDCVAPPAQHQNPMYDSTAASFKTQVNITGGGHCYFANNNFNCSFGESTCSPAPSISRAQQQAAVNDFLQLWLAYYLKGDCNAAVQFQDSLTTSDRVTFRQSQPIGCVTEIGQIDIMNEISIFPNPAHNKVNVECKTPNQELTLYDATGRTVLKQKLTFPLSVFDLQLNAGIYFAKVLGIKKVFTQKLAIE